MRKGMGNDIENYDTENYITTFVCAIRVSLDMKPILPENHCKWHHMITINVVR